MKARTYYFLWIILLFTSTEICAQMREGISFGVKVGMHQTSTRITNKPSNFLYQLSGIGSFNGFQIGGWSKIPINRRLFIDTDLGFYQKGNRYQDPNNKDIIFATNKYNYIGLSGRFGGIYKGVFISLGPEVNVLTSKKVMGQSEANSTEWGINARLGYQYKRYRIETFYSKSLTPYDQRTFEIMKDEVKHLFSSQTIGIVLGVKLFEQKNQ